MVDAIRKLINTYSIQVKTCKKILEGGDNLSDQEYLQTRIDTYRDVIWDLRRMIGE